MKTICTLVFLTAFTGSFAQDHIKRAYRMDVQTRNLNGTVQLIFSR